MLTTIFQTLIYCSRSEYIFFYTLKILCKGFKHAPKNIDWHDMESKNIDKSLIWIITNSYLWRHKVLSENVNIVIYDKLLLIFPNCRIQKLCRNGIYRVLFDMYLAIHKLLGNRNYGLWLYLSVTEGTATLNTEGVKVTVMVTMDCF